LFCGAHRGGDVVSPCPICGAPTPAPERILPLAIQFFPATRPGLALFLCHGAVEVDQGLLRFGIIARIPWSCRNTRWIPWKNMTSDLQRRSLIAEEMRLALGGLI
jgi:hypothetical protein